MKQRRQAFLPILMSLFIISIYNTPVHSQIGINTSDPKSTLDIAAVSSTSHIAGLTAPRLTLAQLTAKGESLYGIAQKGCIIYITDISGGGNTGQRLNIAVPGYYYFDGSSWVRFNLYAPSQTAGNIKDSFKTADHNGWYLLDGRAITSLPANARTAAASLGFGTTLPDARDKVLKTKSSTETLGSTGGTNSLTITKENLPNITLSASISGTSESGGAAHTHTFSGTSVSGGAAHTHTFSGTSASGGTAHTHAYSTMTVANGGVAHTHTANGTSGSAGAHTHTFTRPNRNSASHRGVTSLNSLWSVDNDMTFTSSSAGAHTHTFSATSSSNTHTHTYSGATGSTTHTHTLAGTSSSVGHAHTFSATSGSAGAHTHTVSGTSSVMTGGSATTLENRAPFMSVNTFIYLGL
ncbi:serine-rich family protein [Dysgonomonas macrotermitis]|uniref:Microcystin-dependent protein n=1 Tax=Dysgonomonas macrotermitis TaxID=1346286 RepID=A0A1M4YTV5_9BACT|nr:hypothetical protein [Dysgonomonas macrotermitis]SHF09201.1 hypothetical protein SAMN05444362_103268 [Dysgonomonas macrotermitis]